MPTPCSSARSPAGPDVPHRHDDLLLPCAMTAATTTACPPSTSSSSSPACSQSRRDSATGEKSYTKSLLDAGHAEDPREDRRGARRARRRAARAATTTRSIHETADLLFHVMVGLTARKIPIERVLDELARRFGTSGHTEKAARTR